MKPRVVFCDRVERRHSLADSQQGWKFTFSKLDEETTITIVDKNPEAFRAGRLYKITFEDLKPEDKVTT